MAYINGNKPIVTNGLVYALDFSNPKNSQNAQVVQSLAFNPFNTFVSGNLATPSISNNGLNLNQISLGAYGVYFSGDLITAFLSSSISSIARNGTFSIAWTALVQSTAPGLFLTQNNNDVILHTRISKTNTTLGFYDSGSNSLFEGKTYGINYGTTPNHCVWVYSSGSSTVYVNGAPITASSTFIQSGVADNRVFGLNGDPVRLNMPWSGVLYNLQVYNRALSQNEVITNYQNAAYTFKIPTTVTASTLDPNTVLYTRTANITDSNTVSAINTFVTSLKSANLWDKLTGIYPFSSLLTSSNAVNLKEPGIFNLVYTGSWSGSTPSSSTAHIRTQWHPQAISNGFSYPTVNTSSLHLTYLSYDLPQNFSTLIGQLGTPVSASGGTITTSGNRTIHTFTTTGSNTFEVFTAGVAEVLVVAGGASGGARHGGGGAGGVVYSASVYFPSGSHIAFVGNGGPATTDAGNGSGTQGSGSYIYTVSASGGGAGGYFYYGSFPGKTGGSSGGNGGQYFVGIGLGSTPVNGIDGQGSAGGLAIASITTQAVLGGGGGALTNGTSQVYAGTFKSNGIGGSGIGYSISGVHTYYGGGGGGGSNLDGGGFGTSPNAGGRGGGGTGGNSTANSSGSENTGGGGGGGDYGTANNLIAKGGSGIIIISYETSATSSNAIQITENGVSASLYNTIQSSITSSGNIGLITVNRNVSSSLLIHKNSISQSFSVPATSSIGVPFYINALNNNFSASSYSPSTVAYASIGSGLTTTEVATYHNLIGQLQANLKRQNTLLDNYSGAAAAYSLRRIGPSNYFGPAIRVRRDSDNTLRDIGFTSDGQLDTVGLLDFVGVTGSGFVNTWYDQSGNSRDAAQATTANQPFIIISGSLSMVNAKTAVNFTTDKGFTFSMPDFSGVTAATMISVSKPNQTLTINGQRANFYLFSSVSWGTVFQAVATDGVAYRFGTGQSSNDNTYNTNLTNAIYISCKNGTNEVGRLNGVDVTTSTTKLAPMTSTTTAQIGLRSEGNTPYNGLQSEILMYRSDNTSNRTLIESNINSYYRIFSSSAAPADPDYQSFITATGITQPTQSAALETLVSDLKSYGLWSKMKAIYPMVTDRNNRLSDSQNLTNNWSQVSSSLTISSSGAPDGSNTGFLFKETAAPIPFQTFTVTTNGSSNYIIDGVSNPTLNLERGKTYNFNKTDGGHPFYIQTVSGVYDPSYVYNTGVTNNGVVTGILTIQVTQDTPQLYYACGSYHAGMVGSLNIINNQDQHFITRTVVDDVVSGSENVVSIFGKYLNRPWINIKTDAGAQGWFNIQTGITGSFTGSNITITPAPNGWYRCALFFTASAATAPRVTEYHLADSDNNLSYAGNTASGSYIWGAQWDSGNLLGPYRVTSNGFGTGSVLDQMKFNLKNAVDTDAGFRLTYSGSWNPGYSGVRGDGVTAYASTKGAVGARSTTWGIAVGMYLRTNFNSPSAYSSTGVENGSRFIAIQFIGGVGLYSIGGTGALVNTSISSTTGLHIASRLDASRVSAYRNTTILGRNTTAPGDFLPTSGYTLSALNGGARFMIHERAFDFISEGLTDYEAKALYWIVQKYQTTLGRQVY